MSEYPNLPDDIDPRACDVMIFVLGILDELKEQGFVEGGQWKLAVNGKGTARFAILKASGFRPTPIEMAQAIEVLQSAHKT